MSDIEIHKVEIRPCTSFNMSGERCEHVAGHPGMHIITIEWTDEEAWTPLSARELNPHLTASVHGVPDLHTEAAVYPPPPQQRDTCLVCDHGPHVGECPVGACDCRNFVSSLA